ncbi:carbohydrate ABC transporter permease [Caldicellulosiruptoraceae bacterium PP1]
MKKVLTNLVLFIGAIIMIFPFYWMIILSTHSSQEIFSFPPPLLFGKNLLKNMEVLINTLPLIKNFINSCIVAFSSVVLVLFFCSMAGYAFAMYDFPGKNALFLILLASMMIPSIMTIVPWFIMMTQFGWVNKFWGLIIPGAANAFGIFWMRQYCETVVSKQLIEAAQIDGCPEFKLYFKIIMPILQPGMAALGIYTFINNWNNFMGPLLILKDPEYFTLPVALSALKGDPTRGYDYGVLMAGTMVAVIPILIIYILFSKYIIAGMTAGALKE